LRMRSNQRGNQYKGKVVLVWPVSLKVPLHGAWFGEPGLLIVSALNRGTSPQRVEGIKHTGKNRVRVWSTQEASIISSTRYDEIQWPETDSFAASH